MRGVIWRCLEQVKALKIDLRQIVVRVDSGHDDRKFIKALDEYGVKFIIKRNLRGEPRERYLELGKQYGAKQPSREGKNVWHYSWGNIPVDKSDELFDAEEESMRGTMTMVVAATERQTHAKTGEVFLFPEIEIDSWWTNIDCTEEECIAGYHDHGTSEQFHSELKTDMNIEKLPSGKIATNALILNIAALAFNCLRITVPFTKVPLPCFFTRYPSFTKISIAFLTVTRETEKLSANCSSV